MKILIAPNAYKECLSAPDAARAMAEGIKKVLPDAELVLCPVADGGDGTLEAILDATGGQKAQTKVTDPLGRPIRAPFGILGKGNGAVIEMAAASGLHLLQPSERNPLVTSTRGTGELMAAAILRGVRYIVLGIGGSATVDGGTGMGRALGVRFLDEAGEEIPEGGGSLVHLAHIDDSKKNSGLRTCRIKIASDVTNPLLGPDGAARVYGPQKGATPEMVEQLEAGLARLSEVIKKDLGIDIANAPGAGAAGGLGAGLLAFTHARMHPGVELVLEEVGFHEKLEGADLVLTGEGRVDSQTSFGKAPAGVARAAKEKNIPVWCLAGIVEDGAPEALEKIGIEKTVSINPPDSSSEESIRQAAQRLRETAGRLTAEWTGQQ